MAEPLTREEREVILRQPYGQVYGMHVEIIRDRYEASVQAAEELAEALRAALVKFVDSYGQDPATGPSLSDTRDAWAEAQDILAGIYSLERLDHEGGGPKDAKRGDS